MLMQTTVPDGEARRGAPSRHSVKDNKEKNKPM
jgi:hypothetical protein